jgi:hypothetical protein
MALSSGYEASLIRSIVAAASPGVYIRPPYPAPMLQGRPVFRSFNPEPTATVFFSGFAAVAVSSGLNDPLPILKN